MYTYINIILYYIVKRGLYNVCFTRKTFVITYLKSGNTMVSLSNFNRTQNILNSLYNSCSSIC